MCRGTQGSGSPKFHVAATSSWTKWISMPLSTQIEEKNIKKWNLASHNHGCPETIKQRDCGSAHRCTRRSTSESLPPRARLTDEQQCNFPPVTPHPRSTPTDDRAGILQGLEEGDGWREHVLLESPCYCRRPSWIAVAAPHESSPPWDTRVGWKRIEGWDRWVDERVGRRLVGRGRRVATGVRGMVWMIGWLVWYGLSTWVDLGA